MAFCAAVSFTPKHLVIIFSIYFMKGLQHVCRILKITIKDFYAKVLTKYNKNRHVLETLSELLYQRTTSYKMKRDISKGAFLNAFYEYASYAWQ